MKITRYFSVRDHRMPDEKHILRLINVHDAFKFCRRPEDWEALWEGAGRDLTPREKSFEIRMWLGGVSADGYKGWILFLFWVLGHHFTKVRERRNR